MKALTFEAVTQVKYDTTADPILESPTDALVKVHVTAICGSDLHVYHGREHGLDPGTVLGHEFVGEIIEAGSELRNFVVGERVVSAFTTSCGGCFYCHKGLTARCETGQLFGWIEAGRGLQGAQAEYVRVPLADTTLLPIPPDTSSENALFAGDVLSTGLYCTENAELSGGESIAVLGCGPVGLMAILAAREKQPERVYAIDRVPERLQIAKEFGAIPLQLDTLDVTEQVGQETEGRGVDVVLELVGSQQASRLAYDLVRPGGCISAAGVHTEPTFAFSPGEVYDKNLRYVAGRCPARHMMQKSLPMTGKLAPELQRVISHRLPLSKGVHAYDMFARKLSACTKVLLTPDARDSEP